MFSRLNVLTVKRRKRKNNFVENWKTPMKAVL
jgi:hypothetical protein